MERFQKLMGTIVAFEAFEEDVKKVFDWLTQHGEAYLINNNAIGEIRRVSGCKEVCNFQEKLLLKPAI